MATDRFADVQPTVRGLDPDPFRRDEHFLSLRWKLVFPLFAILLSFAMIATYLITDAVTLRGRASETDQLLLAVQGADRGMRALHDDQMNAAVRIAFTEGVAGAVAADDDQALRRILEPAAIAADLDGVIILDSSGTEVLGLERISPDHRTGYALSTGTDMHEQPLVRAVLQGGRQEATGLLRTPEGYVLYTALPMTVDGYPAGVVLVGVHLSRVLEMLRGSSLAQVALYDVQSGSLLQTTFPASDGNFEALDVSPEVLRQALTGQASVPVGLHIVGYAYQVAYRPFVVGADTLGVLGVFLPSSLPYASDLSRQLISLLMAALAATVVVGGYLAIGHMLGRIARVTATAQALAQGDLGARTAMQATDEIGELGRSLDVYADRVQLRQDSLRTMLRRQRREIARMAATFEAIPDGVVVQDMDGRVLLMNDRARQLLGSHRAFRSSGLGALTAAVTDVLGPALAPGIYALGGPQRVPLDERMLSVQAAAVATLTGKRSGTVLLIRDITEQVQRERAQEVLLQELSRDVQEPLMELVALRSPADADPPLQRFAYEVMRHAIRLQRMIARLNDLTDLGPEQVAAGQRPLAVAELLNDLAAEWSPAIQGAGLSLEMRVEDEGIYVLGDERRLRWALGNLLDNAIKYTPAGGSLFLAGRRQSERMAQIMVMDSGVGISARDKQFVFERFYRGTPRLPDGRPLRVPGMGQGLFIARRVIEAHGGTIHLRSRPGQGTQVICTLPLTAPVTMAIPGQPAVTQSASLPLDRHGGRSERTAPHR